MFPKTSVKFEMDKTNTSSLCIHGNGREQQNDILDSRVSSLQYICLKKTYEILTPLNYERYMAQMDDIFGDLDYVFKKEEEFRNNITDLAYKNDGVLFGGAPRDDINHEIPKDLDFFFQKEEGIAQFLRHGLENQWIVVKDEIDTQYFTLDSVNIRKIKMIARQKIDLMENTEHRTDAKIKAFDSNRINRYHFIEINLDITVETEPQKQDIFHYLSYNVDMDVNQIYYADPQRRIIQTRFKMKKRFSELKRQILRKEFKILCQTDSFLESNESRCFDRRFSTSVIMERKSKMEERGWRCINKTCSYPYCIFSEDSAFKTQIKNDAHKYEMLEFKHLQKEWSNISSLIDDIMMKEMTMIVVDLKDFRIEIFEKKFKSKKIKDKKREAKKSSINCK